MRQLFFYFTVLFLAAFYQADTIFAFESVSEPFETHQINTDSKIKLQHVEGVQVSTNRGLESSKYRRHSLLTSGKIKFN